SGIALGPNACRRRSASALVSPIGELAAAIFASAATRVFSSAAPIVIVSNQTDHDCHRLRVGVDQGLELNRRAVGSILCGADPGPCRLQIRGRTLVSRFGLVPTVFAGGVERARCLFDVAPGALNFA